jgi:hypothetical protein
VSSGGRVVSFIEVKCRPSTVVESQGLRAVRRVSNID